MKTFSGRPASQREYELQRFITFLQAVGCRSYLEIGARHGDTFHAVMSALPQGSYGIAVDLPGGAWGQPNSEPALDRACDDLRARGYSVEVILGNSGEPEVFRKVLNHTTEYGLLNACLIDGDHRYEAVMRDFGIYAQAARLVALHDIDGEGQVQKTSKLPVEVPRAWKEICNLGFPTHEIIGEVGGMGIGLVGIDPDLQRWFK